MMKNLLLSKYRNIVSPTTYVCAMHGKCCLYFFARARCFLLLSALLLLAFSFFSLFRSLRLMERMQNKNNNNGLNEKKTLEEEVEKKNEEILEKSDINQYLYSNESIRKVRRHLIFLQFYSVFFFFLFDRCLTCAAYNLDN